MKIFVRVAFLACLLAPVAAQAEPIAVEVLNATTPTQCAEEDNVYFKLLSPTASRFAIEASQPAYMRHVSLDVTGPDFTNCAITDAKDFSFTPKEVVLHEDSDILIKGLTLDRFWRQAAVPTTVAGKVTDGLHLIQVFTKRVRGKPFEFLVLYPSDGNWRARPKPLPGHAENVYGSSFLIGPVEEKGRPIADVASVEIMPRERNFRLTFKAGGSATVHFSEPGRERLTLAVTLDRKGADPGLPFAGLRSMYVSEANADAARVLWRSQADGALFGREIPRFSRDNAIDIRFDRIIPSVHNTSAPDMRFRDFGR